ncbi:DUF3158 family protein [Pseudomonas sp. Fig-3]|uniref:DUF3158 family protein n=1 Tax=unclassified Pseudomonas TaxID=196821 RepID=UPI0010D74452|nr:MULTISPECIES: DUF3158 family protein [unclassified Pseudomonas]TNB81572.1 DUF3158 family protein [Pseudomonas sp. Fig-3]VII91708.1 Integrase regulator R [Pseudomonas sp. FG-3G]
MTLAEAIARRLSADAYRELEQGASLKGLLKPFKGKGELQQFAETILRLRTELAGLMGAMLAIMAQPPFSLLDLRLVVQHSATGTDFLRWRSPDFQRMGVQVWQQAMGHSHLTPVLREALYQLEVNRVTLNLQMSSLQSLYRQAVTGVSKMQAAETTFQTSSSPTEE